MTQAEQAETEQVGAEFARPELADEKALPTRGAICPRLGLRDDPSTAAAYAYAEHVCYEPSRPASIHPDIQTRFCLAGRYPRCPVYQGIEKRPPRAPWRLPKLDRRQVLVGLVFVVLVPATIGALAALLDNDGPGTPVQAVATVPDTRLIEPAAQTNDPAADATTPASGGLADESDDSVVADVTSAVELSPREQLSAWESVADWEVQAGDSLGAIAREFGTTVEAIAVYNGIENTDTVFIGQVLQVPVGFTLTLDPEETVAGADAAATGDEPVATSEPAEPAPPPLVLSEEAVAELLAWPDLVAYEVKDGDSLFAIAGDFGTTVEAIAVLNDLNPNNALPIGAVVRVPQGFTTPLTVAPATADTSTDVTADGEGTEGTPDDAESEEPSPTVEAAPDDSTTNDGGETGETQGG